MYRYVIVFIIVCILTRLAEIGFKKNKFEGLFFCFLSILILSLFAAFRALSVGTDIHVYGLEYFEKVGTCKDLFSYLSKFDNEKMYFVLNYIVYQISDNIHFLFFVFQFLIASVIYYIAYKDYGKMWLYILTYLLLIYNSSFNILRQILAIIIILYGFRYIEEKKWIKYFVCVTIAQFFHSSAVLCYVIPVISLISKTKHKYLYTVMLCIASITFLSMLDQIIYLFVKYSIISDKYLHYMTAEETNFNYKMALVKVYLLIITLLFSKKASNKKENNLLILLGVFDLVAFCSSSFIRYGYRMSYYILPFFIILIPRIDHDIDDYKTRTIYRILIISALILYWVVRYAIFKYDGTVPYTFYWE